MDQSSLYRPSLTLGSPETDSFRIRLTSWLPARYLLRAVIDAALYRLHPACLTKRVLIYLRPLLGNYYNGSSLNVYNQGIRLVGPQASS
jgi:hypothetical protein